MPRFGGIPVEQPAASTGPRFRGVALDQPQTAIASDGSVIPVDLVTPGQDPDSLAAAFYAAKARMDGQAATKAFRAIRAQGATLRGPNADELAATQRPAEGDSSPGGIVKESAMALAHHLANAPVGIAQLALHAGNYMGNGGPAGELNRAYAQDQLNHSMAGLVSGGQAKLPAQTPGEELSDALDKYAADRETDYQRVVPNSPAAIGGAVVGEIAPALTGLSGLRAARILPTAATKLGRVGTLGLEGGLLGAVQPVTSSDYGKAKAAQVATGALTSAGVGTAGMGLAGLYRGTKGVLSQAFNPDAAVGSNLAKLYGSDPAVIAALRNAPEYVPGEVPSAAQVLQTPEAVQAERMLRNNPEAAKAFLARDNANNAARLGVVQNLAGDDSALQSAIAKRRAGVADFISQNLPDEGSVPVDVSGIRQSLQKLSTNGNDTVRQAAKKHLSLLDELSQANGGKVPATDLDSIRQGVNGTLASVKSTGAVSPQEAALYGPVSDQITSAIDSTVPGYRNYLAAYAKLSQPITDMEAAQGLLDPNVSGSLNTAGDPQLAISRLRTALRADDRANYGVSDEAKQQLENVRNSLLRRSISDNKTGAAGSNTAADLQLQPQGGLLGRAVFGSGLNNKGGWAGRAIGGAVGGLAGSAFGPAGSAAGIALGGGLTDAIGSANARALGRIGATAADSKATAAAIEAWLAKQPKAERGLLSMYLYGLPSAPAAQATK